MTLLGRGLRPSEIHLRPGQNSWPIKGEQTAYTFINICIVYNEWFKEILIYKGLVDIHIKTLYNPKIMVREGFVTNLLAYQHVTWVTCTKSLLPEVTKRNSHKSLSFAIINDLCSFDVDHLGDICIQTHTIQVLKIFFFLPWNSYLPLIETVLHIKLDFLTFKKNLYCF